MTFFLKIHFAGSMKSGIGQKDPAGLTMIKRGALPDFRQDAKGSCLILFFLIFSAFSV